MNPATIDRPIEEIEREEFARDQLRDDRANPFRVVPDELRDEQPTDHNHGRLVTWGVYDADETLVASYLLLSDAILRKRVVPGRYIRLRMDPFGS